MRNTENQDFLVTLIRSIVVFTITLILVFVGFKACNIDIITTPTVTATLTTTVTSTPTAINTLTPTVTSTSTNTPTKTVTRTSTVTQTPSNQCPNYWINCVDVAKSCPAGSIQDLEKQCGPGFRCCVPTGGIVTPTVIPIVTPTAKPVTPTGKTAPPGGYLQYDYPCQYPLVNAFAPNGIKMLLCPNGLNFDGTFKNNNAFREAGGMNWPKLASVYSSEQFVNFGGTFWVDWASLNPGNSVYNWYLIDNIVAGSASITMDTPSGSQQKGVVIRLYSSVSTRPAQQFISGIDGGFIFDDLTPQWVKSQMVENIPWGGPKKLDDTVIARDNGSYWIKMPCVYPDYQASKPQNSLWNYSIWVMPKYNKPAWINAATKLLTDVGKHYEGSNITFMLGLAGMDGEHGNYIQNNFAGCGNLRTALNAQYNVSGSDLLFDNMTKIWRKFAPTVKTFVSCTSDCNPNWFFDQNVGIFQARAVDDGAALHRAGDAGVLDWAIRFAERGLPVAWENAHTSAESRYMYQMLSLVMQSWPEWFSFVGGSWANAPIIKQFLPYFGRTITTTNEIWFQSYWSCYSYPDFVDCPDRADDSGNFSQYSGWLRNIEVGLSSDAQLQFVNPWTELTVEQQKGLWYRMLRKVNGSIGFTVDSRWGFINSNSFVVKLSYLDQGVGSIIVSCLKPDKTLEQLVFTRTNTKKEVTREAEFSNCRIGEKIDGKYNILLDVSGDILFFHKLLVHAQ